MKNFIKDGFMLVLLAVLLIINQVLLIHNHNTAKIERQKLIDNVNLLHSEMHRQDSLIKADQLKDSIRWEKLFSK